MEATQNSRMHSTITALKALVNADLEKQMQDVKILYDMFRCREGFHEKFPTLKDYALHWKDVRSEYLNQITAVGYTPPIRYISSLPAYQMNLSLETKEMKVRKDYLLFLHMIVGMTATHHITNFLVPRLLKFT